MTDVLIYGDTYRTPDLRHEVPLAITDPFLYAEHDGTRHMQIRSAEIPRFADLGGFELHPWEEFGSDDLIAQGLSRYEIVEELVRRAVTSFGVRSAVVPETFPLHFADLLRADGVELRTDREFFNDRRRVKSEFELAGIRRAQRAAEAGMDAARDLLRRASEGRSGLEVDGEPLSSERIKITMAQAFVAHGATADDFIISHGAQSAIGHHMGAGQLQARESVVIDVWPRDNESACYADMTRTYVVGDVPGELAEWFAVAKEALDHSFAEIREGISGRALYDASCDIFEAAGYATLRTKRRGKPLEEGYMHSLGHGVGLEVHEQPVLGLMSQDLLRAGDVVTVEPGLYRPGFGGLRLEDLALVTVDGTENLTRYPYDLTP